MLYIARKHLFSLALVVLATLAAVNAQAVVPRMSKDIDGVTVYLGVVPSALFIGHPKEHSEAQMHGGPPAGPHQFHILVALYDSKTGMRIADAKVSASAAVVGSTSSSRSLEPMAMAGTIAYGNYFTLGGEGTYAIHLKIVLHDRRVLHTVFDYQHGVS